MTARHYGAIFTQVGGGLRAPWGWLPVPLARCRCPEHGLSPLPAPGSRCPFFPRPRSAPLPAPAAADPSLTVAVPPPRHEGAECRQESAAPRGTGADTGTGAEKGAQRGRHFAARRGAARPRPRRPAASLRPAPIGRRCRCPQRACAIGRRGPRSSPRVSALHVSRGRAARPRGHRPTPRGAERVAAPGPASAEGRCPRGTWERKASGIAARMRGPRAERCVRPCVGHARVRRSSSPWLQEVVRMCSACRGTPRVWSGTPGASARAGLVTAQRLTRVCAARVSVRVASMLMCVTHTCHPCVSVCNTYIGACNIFVQSMCYARYVMHVLAYIADTCKPCACAPQVPVTHILVQMTCNPRVMQLTCML